MSDFFSFASKVVFYLFTQFAMFSFFKGTYQRNRCTFKKILKSHIFIFDSAPCQIYLSLHQILCFTYLQSLQIFFFLQRNISFFKVPIKEIGALSKKKYKITFFNFLQCALSDFFIFTPKIVFYLLTKLKKFIIVFQRYLPKKKVHFQT